MLTADPMLKLPLPTPTSYATSRSYGHFRSLAYSN
jgi:hypothetical protein